MNPKDLKWSMEMMFMWLTLLWKCTSRAWDLIAIPWPHSIVAILWKQKDITVMSLLD
ncbi:hypothetical protein Gogos_012062, partial [Gossypium gossypioides]|nr:hypothetical protein [Gossypium gossypioides]